MKKACDDMDRPITTLFMLMSVDGKITTGSSDHLDFDQDLPRIHGCWEGLQQYYDIEQTTDLWSLNSGRVQAKLGVNHMDAPTKSPVSFVLIDNTHLSEQGVRYFCRRSRKFVLVTTNPRHPAFGVQESNLHIILQKKLDLKAVLERLAQEHRCERITIQSGGTLNGLFLRQKLLDFVDLVVAPLLVGGKETTTLIDGESISGTDQLAQLGVLKLESAQVLEHSYLRLRYRVIT